MGKNFISLDIEKNLWQKGYKHIAGVDEAGRGPLAGPVVAAAVVFDHDEYIEGVNDSKKLNPKRREELFEEITTKALTYGIGVVDNNEIDRINILQATHKAMRKALGSLKLKIDYIIVDGYGLPEKIYPQKAIHGGDKLSFTIASASILAKVFRDRLMREYDKIFPEYGFGKHMGYGTKEHIEAIKKHNPSPIHRKSFSRVKEYLNNIYKNNKTIGKYGEQLAVKYLFDKGFNIIKRNYRVGTLGEIDIIAQKDECIYFVEVKTQLSDRFGPAEFRVDEIKQSQIAKIAEQFLFEQRYKTNLDVKFSVIAIDLKNKIEKIRFYPNAFIIE
ncbi:MAG: ribonuclease HII [Candidatus Marinimicrobia bacterium]|nr:ribonuclease HII [Candidatus Neomarinimicrobiota bacterium]